MKKTITFDKPSHLQLRPTAGYLFPYHMIDSSLIGSPEQESRTLLYHIKVLCSFDLVVGWGVGDSDSPGLIKVLFEYGKRHVLQKLKGGELSENEELILNPSNSEIPCPFDPNKISDPNGSVIEVQLAEPADFTYLQIGSGIINTRDNINAIFYSKKNVRLILVHEERDFLQLISDASSQEDLSFRICALANAATAFNNDYLRKETGISDSNVKSITLIEEYLKKIGIQCSDIIGTLRNINVLRQGYPVHSYRDRDMRGAYQYFNLEYPVRDFGRAWKVILEKYLDALHLLLERLKTL